MHRSSVCQSALATLVACCTHWITSLVLRESSHTEDELIGLDASEVHHACEFNLWWSVRQYDCSMLNGLSPHLDTPVHLKSKTLVKSTFGKFPPDSCTWSGLGRFATHHKGWSPCTGRS
eukprot:1041703-Amphidinium_carterae.1